MCLERRDVTASVTRHSVTVGGGVAARLDDSAVVTVFDLILLLQLLTFLTLTALEEGRLRCE